MRSKSKLNRFSVDPALAEWIRDIRRYIHAHPEISYKEKNTAAYIQQKLKEKGIVSNGQIAETGVVATLPSRVSDLQGVALRADMDALPVVEETGLGFASKNHGVMHACGHDGHVAMLLGAAALLSTTELSAPVRLLFQPAEEKGNGAVKMIEGNVLENIGAVFAGHIDTHFPIGTITVDEGIICAYADSFCIRVKGRSGHAARPHEAVDSVVAASNLVLSAQTLVSREVNPNRSAVLSFATFQAGTVQNVIAQEAVLSGTVRCSHGETRKRIIAGLERVVRSIAEMHGVETSISFYDSIPAVENQAEVAAFARKAAKITGGVDTVTSQGASSLGAEDFAYYQEKVQGCMVRFGASLNGTTGAAHSRTFNFDEKVLAIGASWYANVACGWLAGRSGGE